MPDKHDDLSEKFVAIISRAAQLLCQSQHNCSWGTTRTSGMTIWALSECGLGKTHRKFITHCLNELLTKETIRDDKRLCFNAEVWDTSVALIALCLGEATEFRKEIDLIKKWLLSEVRHDNFKNEPWETMWGVMALLESRDNVTETAQLAKRCISWVLDKRNKKGILISPHYMGFLLTVLNYAMYSHNLSDEDKEQFQQPIDICENYLRNEFFESQTKGKLWGNEPWSIGHVLLGIAESFQKSEQFFKDDGFNESLLNWYNDEWIQNVGWVDILDTSCTLIGLVKYYRNREIFLNYGRHEAGEKAVEKISSSINFKYKDIRSKKMEVFPLWNSRDFIPQSKLFFILMPFKEEWSNRIFKLLKGILKQQGFDAIRADQKYFGKSSEKIWLSLNEARLIIADISNNNPNVLYEIGIAHTIGKDVIIISKDMDKIPFNLKGVDIIPYSDNMDGYQVLKREIPKSIETALRGR